MSGNATSAHRLRLMLALVDPRLRAGEDSDLHQRQQLDCAVSVIAHEESRRL
jgi:hypothetical protein